MDRGLEFIKSAKGSVYIHCKAGRTRSAYIVACYLMATQRQTAADGSPSRSSLMSPEDAFACLKAIRKEVVLTQDHWDGLRLYAGILQSRLDQKEQSSE